jgi:hypothetical protein
VRLRSEAIEAAWAAGLRSTDEELDKAFFVDRADQQAEATLLLQGLSRLAGHTFWELRENGETADGLGEDSPTDD